MFLLVIPIEVCTHLKSLKGLHRSHYKADTWKGKVEEANIWISLVDETSLNVEKSSLIDWKHSLLLSRVIKGVEKVCEGENLRWNRPNNDCFQHLGQSHTYSGLF